MISPAVLEFMGWLLTLHVVPLIKELRDGAERIRRHELSRALARMDLSPEEEAAVERMSHALVNKLLARPHPGDKGPRRGRVPPGERRGPAPPPRPGRPRGGAAPLPPRFR